MTRIAIAIGIAGACRNRSVTTTQCDIAAIGGIGAIGKINIPIRIRICIGIYGETCGVNNTRYITGVGNAKPTAAIANDSAVSGKEHITCAATCGCGISNGSIDI